MRRVHWLAALSAMVGLAMLAAAFGLSGWPPSAASAAPLADCNSPAWKKAAPDLLSDLPNFKCKTLESGPAAGVNIRVVVDEALKDPLVAEMAPLIFQGGTKSLPKYKGYRPSLALKNVTYVIIAAPDRKDEALAEVGLGGECVVYVFITTTIAAQTAAKRAVGVPFTAAHEAVHCTQYWNFAPQMMTPSDDRRWWSESTADYLASSVFDDKPGLTALADNFAYKIKDQPITELSYDAYPFFAWLGGKKGVANTYAFMAAMPTGGGVKAQQAALVAQAGGAAGLQDFATSFIDGTIKVPFGWTLPRPALQPVTITGSGEKTYVAKPFTILLAALNFTGGEYELAATTSTQPEARWSENDGPWGAAPKSIGKTCEGASAGLRVGLFALGSGKTNVVLNVNKTDKGTPENDEDKCKKKEVPKPPSGCTPLPQKDSCLVGKWAIDGDKVTDMLDAALRKMGVYGAKDGTGWNGDAFFTVDSGGTGKMSFKAFELDTHSHSPTGIYVTTVDGDLSGGWSTSAGTLRYCPTANTVTIRTDTTLFLYADGGVKKVENSVTVPGGGDMQDFTYTCDAHTLMLKPKSGATLQGAPLVWYYHR